MIIRAILVTIFSISLLFAVPLVTTASQVKTESGMAQKLAVLVDKAEFNSFHAVALQAGYQALNQLGHPDAKNLLVVTNAGYAKVDDQSSAPCLDALTAVTGCTVGKGNLLTVHSAAFTPLYFFVYDSLSGRAAYLEVDKNTKIGGTSFTQMLDKKDLFAYQAVETIMASKLIANPEIWDKKLKNRIFNGREFSLVSIANLWTDKAPADLMQAALFHDHFCPGVTAGYYLAKFLLDKYPLADNQSYHIIASPAWCKDDALQVMLNCTVGKGNMVVYPLADTDKQYLLPEAKDAAGINFVKNTGIYFMYNKKAKTGKGVVLGFDWDKLCKESGISFGREYPWRDNLQCDLWMNRHSNDYARYVTVIKEFELEQGSAPGDYIGPSINPWKKLDLWQNK
ncbi:FmdE, Molybdenum formylmethanofuran dehydrogenase operon [Sporomusa ovata DSM 2662]|uniref:Protein containing a metal-binding domain shared with formylmethanofuran dehydrogenase subunit E n=1 Tax=Sporomusa ovata TaxID=2378 RepID=A0A0U1KRY6_9FIRM|nr:FmdE family protein [Sporomusa ovata]EQB24985.1 molybdenum formylmethanofuran dehydrogenase [Sporomusa ovata DSM 2662]CQR70188.1 Protein containing a metal-binding domain shared with formylmethanofuran dehydrogenase subunit E [Sporomusa ovata]